MTRKIEWTNDQIAAVAYRYNFYELGPDDDDDEDVADQPTPEELREALRELVRLRAATWKPLDLELVSKWLTETLRAAVSDFVGATSPDALAWAETVPAHMIESIGVNGVRLSEAVASLKVWLEGKTVLAWRTLPVATVHANGTADIRARVICEPRLARPRAELLALMPPATTKETTDVEVVGARGHVNAGQVVFPTDRGAFTLLPTGGYVKPAGIIMAWLNGTRCRVQMFTPGAGNNRETTCD